MKNSNSRLVFTKRNSRRKLPIYRQLLEATVMLFIGTNLLYYLNTLPNRNSWSTNIVDKWNQFIESSILILNSLVTLSSLVFIILLIIIGVGLVLGGVLRIIRLLVFIKISSSNSRKVRDRQNL